MKILQATTPEQLQGILDLQKVNLKEVVPESLHREQGFVTVKHSLDVLLAMNRKLNHLIAVENDRVVGYALAMHPDLKEQIPKLITMFERIETLSYQGNPLHRSRFYIMGQICIAQAYRGQGLFAKLYEAHRECYSGQFDYLITEVSGNNPRSLKAHEKVGFETLLKYRDTADLWHLILWDWMQENQSISSYPDFSGK
jgi:GNAT superfamily N-acetyltransferase